MDSTSIQVEVGHEAPPGGAKPPPAEASPVPTGTPVKLEWLGLKSLMIVRHLHLSWFSVVMGWGGTALAIDGFPGAAGDFKHVLNIIATVIWIWAWAYCAVLLLLLLARIILYPVEFWAMMKKPSHFLFFGCVPMALGVVGIGFVTLGTNIMSDRTASDVALVIFWVDLSLVIISMTLPFTMLGLYNEYELHSFPSFCLFPFLSAVVCAAFAGAVGPYMNSPTDELSINIAGYILLGAGLFCSACIIPSYMVQLIINGFPPSAMGNSVWVVLGPIGQGATALMTLGRETGVLQCRGALCQGSTDLIPGSCICLVKDAGNTGAIPLNPLNSFGLLAPGASLFMGCMMWGFGVWWLFFATTATLYHTRKLNTLLGWCQAQFRAWGTRRAVLNMQRGESDAPLTVSVSIRGGENDPISFPQRPPFDAQARTNPLLPVSSPTFVEGKLPASGVAGVAAAGDGGKVGLSHAARRLETEVTSPGASEHMPFSLGWWAVVFPLVTLVMATYQLHIDTQWSFFLWMGRILCTCLVCTSFYVHFKTGHHALFRHDFWHKFHAV